MGLMQVGIVSLAVLVRLTAFGWYALIAIAVSLLSLGMVPAIVVGPLIYAGFCAPASAWPLLTAADVLLMVCALTFEDGGDNGSTSPLQVLTGRRGSSGRGTDRVFRFCGAAYVVTLPALAIWTVSG
ncbi:hypothetical protein ACFYW1_03965 [Streptomyces sp. NPDC002669]|uniref:hypothetical protein n=1 Tax=Streptomyces sp. NPDC002669 TaxID=3364658 RepID=UPI0036A72D18